MNLHLSDLDELVENVRNSYSRTYLNEAVVAYRSGAYRAAVISTWISVCVDIIEKIKELSLGSDAAAKVIETKLNNIKSTDVGSMLTFEKEILNYACEELELISFIEKSHLERLKDDRNICAHPTFSVDGSQFVPSPELTRAYIVQAANYLLINAPIKGKVVVNDIYHLINEESFPNTDERAFIVLSSEKYLGRVRDSSVKNLTIILFKRLFKDEALISPDLINKISSALGAISRLYPIIYQDVGKEKLSQMLAEANDKLLKRILLVLCRREELWRFIDKAVVLRLEESIASMDCNDMIKYGVSNVSALIPAINDTFQDIINKDDFVGITRILKESPSKQLTDIAIKYFVKSESFAEAYRNGIDYLIPYAEFINDEKLEILFDGIYENSQWGINQILDAGGIGEVLCSVYEKTKPSVFRHSQLWLEFVEKVKDKGFTYKNLNELLINDGVIKVDKEDN